MNPEIIDLNTTGTQPNEVKDTKFFTAWPNDQNIFDRIVAIFTSPREAFEGIELVHQTSAWLLPLLLSVLLTSASYGIKYFATTAAQDDVKISQAYVLKMAENTKLSQEARKSIVEAAAKQNVNVTQSAIRGFLIGFFVPLLGTLCSSVFFLAIARFVFGNEEVTYRVILSVASLSLLLNSVGDMIALILQTLVLEQPVELNPCHFYFTFRWHCLYYPGPIRNLQGLGSSGLLACVFLTCSETHTHRNRRGIRELDITDCDRFGPLGHSTQSRELAV